MAAGSAGPPSNAKPLWLTTICGCLPQSPPGASRPKCCLKASRLSTSTAADGTAKASASVAAMMQPVAGFMSSPPSSFAPVADAQRPGQGVIVDPHEHQGCVVVPGQHHAHLVAIEIGRAHV